MLFEKKKSILRKTKECCISHVVLVEMVTCEGEFTLDISVFFKFCFHIKVQF